MINFRKIKQDFSPSIVKEGRGLFDQEMVVSAKVVQMDGSSIRISGQVLGNFDNCYECELELDREESEATDSNCDCPYNFDCQHLAALLFYLERNLDELIVAYSKEANLDGNATIGDEEIAELKKTFAVAKTKEEKRKGKEFRKELLVEYKGAAEVLGQSAFFRPENDSKVDKAELAIILCQQDEQQTKARYDAVQIALRLPYRSKPLNIPNIREFAEGVQYCEPVYVSGKQYLFTRDSFDTQSRALVDLLLNAMRFPEHLNPPLNPRMALMDPEGLGLLLAHAHEEAVLAMAA
ncbi:MAG: SWIM zinc finger family protein, partial [Chlamydiia bacterium]|nr:SWIM zinc finger family protein [Chlamydiia bacterium]